MFSPMPHMTGSGCKPAVRAGLAGVQQSGPLVHGTDDEIGEEAGHFLVHGTWAFKARTEGERTDLVLGAPLHVDDNVRRASDALVLTEWKRVIDPRKCKKAGR